MAAGKRGRRSSGVAPGLRRTPRPTTDAEQLVLDLQPDAFDDGLSFHEWMLSLRAEGGQYEPGFSGAPRASAGAEQVTVPGGCLSRTSDSPSGAA